MPTVADLETGKFDGLGQKISCIYGRKAPVYGVYGAGRRVMICFADVSEGDVSQQQRKAMSTLAPLRGEIDGLIDGWRQGTNRSLTGARHSPTLQGKANRYNRRVADALIVALEGDVAGATTILAAIKQEILDERVARARFEYLIAAVLTGAALMFAAWLVTATYALRGEADPSGRTFAVGIILLLLALLMACGFFYARWDQGSGADERSFHDEHAGEAGAAAAEPAAPGAWAKFANSLVPSLLLFAVVAIPITAMLLLSTFTRGVTRPYASDYDLAVSLWRAAAAGSVGAFFSIAIGIRGRTVLPDLLRTSNLMDAALRVSIGFIGAGVLEALLLLKVVRLGFAGLDLDGNSMLAVLVAGFLAGFSERLVPDLLAKANAQPGVPATPPAAPPATVRPAEPGGGGEPTAVPEAIATVAADPLDAVPEQAHEDGCVSDHGIDKSQITADRDLPAASGGVAAPVTEEPKP